MLKLKDCGYIQEVKASGITELEKKVLQKHLTHKKVMNKYEAKEVLLNLINADEEGKAVISYKENYYYVIIASLDYDIDKARLS